MRTLTLVLAVSFGLAAPALGKKHRSHRPAQHQKHDSQARAPEPRPIPSASKSHEEYERGEAQLAELKASRDVPVTSLTGQASDDEVPGQHVK